MLDENDDITKAPLVGDQLVPYFKKLGIETISTLLYHFPFRYEDKRTLSPIETALNGQLVTISGHIKNVWQKPTRSGIMITHVEIADESAWLEALFFNQPFLVRSLRVGTEVYCSGIMDRNGRSLELKKPEIEIVTEIGPVHTGRIVPIYPETRGLSSKRIRAIMIRLLDKVSVLESLNDELTSAYRMPDLDWAVRMMHFPKTPEDFERAKFRIGFDELLVARLRSSIRRIEWLKNENARKLNTDPLENFIQQLPFVLTSDQQRALSEISSDVSQEIPMNRLLEGEVGSGKTAVAAGLIYLAVKSNLKAIVLAPTEILAQQHYQSLMSLIPEFANYVGLYTGTSKKIDDATKIIVGTHALFHHKTQLSDVGALIIDEQQRFGVRQRSSLMANISQGFTPHVLSMTATPIPRTLALTIFGDLSLSVIEQLPRPKPLVITKVIPESKRQDCWNWLSKQLDNSDDQAFVLCPLIDESESIIAKAANSEFLSIKERFPDLKVGLLHGSLKSKEKQEVVEDFRNGKIQVLVTTSVIEVGIDIPNASIMIIEGAERYGLSSLHQLRGRVGRGNKKSYCFLFVSDESMLGNERLRALEKSHSGFELAELDLETRGSGNLFGTAQSGLPELKHADLSNELMVKQTQEACELILAKGLDSFPLLKARVMIEPDIAPN